MIYLVTQQILPPTDAYKIVSVEDSFKILNPLTIVGLDTETQGMNPHLKNLLLVQLGNYNNQVVIDTTTVDIHIYQEYLESNRLFILQNADFDLRFFYKQHIIIKRLWDTFLAEKVMYLGYPSGTHSMSLKSLGLKYCGIELDKSVRGKILWSKILSDDIVVYAATDVKYLGDIMEQQILLLRTEHLVKAAQLESDFVRVCAYMNYCGVKLDILKWKAKMAKDNEIFASKESALNEWVVKHYGANSKFTAFNLQGDLFTGFDDKPHCTINWGSPKQVINLLEDLGFDLTVKDKDGSYKKSVEAKVVESQKNKSDIAQIYIDYKEAQKLTSTYGQNFIDSINPITHRIYSHFSSLGTDTARLSCGGGDDKETIPGKKLSLINLQNLPHDDETRACFIPEQGNKWISIDYSGQESFLMASIANDKAMLEELTTGSKDMHSLVAKLVFEEIPKDMPTKEIKSKFKALRQEAKGYEFCFAYAGNDSTLVRNYNISPEKASSIYNRYMSGFSGLRDYQAFRKKDVMEKGYILLSPISLYRAHIYDWDKLSACKKEFTSEFWRKYKLIPRDSVTNRKSPRNSTEQDMCDKVSMFAKRRAASEKQSVNYPIQHAGAMCFKLSGIYFFNWLVENNLFDKVKLVIGAHDEWDCECPADIAMGVANKLKECMEKSGAIFCTRAFLTADIEIGDCWIH